jgi:hypothetical protein
MRSGSSRIIALQIAFLASAASGESLLVNPARLYLQAAAGTTIEARVAVSGPVRTTALEGFTLDEEGMPILRADAHQRDLRDWIRVEQREDRDRAILLRVTVPSDAEGTYWAALVIDAREAASEITTRACVPIFVTVAETERVALDLARSTARGAGDRLDVTVRLVNDGNVVLRVPLTVTAETIRGEQRLEVASATEPAVVVLPGSTRVVRLSLHVRQDEPILVEAFALIGPERRLAVAHAAPDLVSR